MMSGDWAGEYKSIKLIVEIWKHMYVEAAF